MGVTDPTAGFAEVVGLVTARGGSKGLPRKNVLPVAGAPLIVHTLRAALTCPLIKDCYVSTDNVEIAGIAHDTGVEVIDRPASLADDGASSVDVAIHALDWLRARGCEPRVLVLLQPTSPLRTAAHLAECLRQFLPSSASSAISVTSADHHPFKMLRVGADGLLEPLVDVASLSLPRQRLPDVFRQNGAIYAVRTTTFREARSFFIPPAMAYFMRPEESIDIDTALDLEIAGRLLNGRASGAPVPLNGCPT